MPAASSAPSRTVSIDIGWTRGVESPRIPGFYIEDSFLQQEHDQHACIHDFCQEACKTPAALLQDKLNTVYKFILAIKTLHMTETFPSQLICAAASSDSAIEEAMRRCLLESI